MTRIAIMSSIQKKRRQCDVLSRRLLTTFRLNDDILLKFKSKGFTLKSEIEFISDSDLQAICGMTDDELETIERVVRKSHMSELRCETGLELKNTIPQFIHTGSYSLNRSINGGLQVGKITQMVAESGSGKTQICMQCCVNVQLPPKNGGLSASALYIDTENSFRPERILQMAKYKIDHIAGLKDSLTPTLMGSRIHLFKCNQPEDLVNILVDKVEIFIDQHPDIKLVIVDSIAYLFRYDFQGTYPKKDNQLSQIAVKLREIAHHKKVAMRFNQLSEQNEAALGRQWQTYCNLSVIFRKYITGNRSGHLIRTTEIQDNYRFYFTIEESGIKESVEGSKWHPDYD